jgi:hypothetical protein
MNSTQPAPTWFKVVAILGLLWNLLGVLGYFWNTVLVEKFMTPELLAQLPEAERQAAELQLQMVQSMPAWATSAFAIAVFGGLLGCVFLLMRRNLAIVFLGLSIVGVIVQNAYSFAVANAMELLGPGALILPALVIVFGLFLFWTALKAKSEGWSR